jgi:nucleotide-binding universal stress UspA family protein
MGKLKVKRILVPTDLSQPALVALREARLFAERFSAAVTVLYVDPIILAASGFGAEVPVYMTDSAEHLGELKEEIRAYAENVLHGLSYDVAAATGQPIPTIVREAEDQAADLIVMATHGLRGWRRVVLGSVTEGVLHGGKSPVLSVSRPEDRAVVPAAVTRILCPINFTDVARESLDYAAHLAAAFQCELVIVHVVEERDLLHEVAAENDVRSWIDPSVQQRCSYREIVLRGGAAERVLDCAEDIGADLLVIGAQHKLFRDTTTIGTTTERLVRFARVPVLTVPRPVEAAAVKPVPPFAAQVGG